MRGKEALVVQCIAQDIEHLNFFCPIIYKVSFLCTFSGDAFLLKQVIYEKIVFKSNYYCTGEIKDVLEVHRQLNLYTVVIFRRIIFFAYLFYFTKWKLELIFYLDLYLCCCKLSQRFEPWSFTYAETFFYFYNEVNC